MLNIALIGYGKMGHVVEEICQQKGINIVAIIDPAAQGATAKEISAESIGKADVCIDFSSANNVVSNVEKIAALKKNIVMATTGWNDQLPKVREIVQKNGIGFIYAGNFSIGVNAFYRIAAKAGQVFNSLEDYDVLSYELHHNRKKDSPSGTAKEIGNILLQNFTRKKKLVFDRLDRQICPDELHIASVRGGDIPGTHVIDFDSSADTIELKHTARNRNGFASGALMAAKWLQGKKGFFTIDDFMKEIIK